MAPIELAFREEWPEAEIYNLLEESLSADLDRAGELNDAMIDRFRTLARYAADCGSDAILFTCSAFGQAIEAAAADLHPMPVLKPNEAMFRDALEIGGTIGLLSSFAPSLPSMAREFEEMKREFGSNATLRTGCEPEAMAALRRGDGEAHDALLASAAHSFSDCDALMLAQFSTARAKQTIAEHLSIPILTSPASAVRRLRSSLAG